jgi:macrodomain Ter protein organizer (MatP/YcbG family)
MKRWWRRRNDGGTLREHVKDVFISIQAHAVWTMISHYIESKFIKTLSNALTALLRDADNGATFGYLHSSYKLYA